MTAARAGALLAAIRAKGCNASDLRDAAHEAHHALTLGLRAPWTRARIDAAFKRKLPDYSDRLSDEIAARAVEQIVCKDLGVDPGDVEKWALITIMEALKIDGVNLGRDALTPIADAIRRAVDSRRGRDAADRVIGIASAKRSVVRP